MVLIGGRICLLHIRAHNCININTALLSWSTFFNDDLIYFLQYIVCVHSLHHQI